MWSLPDIPISGQSTQQSGPPPTAADSNRFRKQRTVDEAKAHK